MSFTGPFTLQRGLDAGLTERILRGPAYQRLLHGVYAPAGLAATTTVRARAALLLAPEGAVVARHTAAILWGGVVPASPDIQLVIPPGSRLRVSGVDARVRRQHETVQHGGLPLTCATQTFLDLAGDLDLVDLVVLGDSLVRSGVATLDDLVAAAAAYRGRHARPLGGPPRTYDRVSTPRWSRASGCCSSSLGFLNPSSTMRCATRRPAACATGST